MAALLMSLLGIASVLLGYVLFRPRRPEPIYIPPIANPAAPDLPIC